MRPSLLHAAATQSPDLNSMDPFVVLGLDRTATDKKLLKKSYKKLAMKYHPDVSTNSKERASAQFAKINWAYQEALQELETVATGSSRTSSSSTGWQPPHRRTGGYTSTGRSTASPSDDASFSTDWRDYMPNYDTTTSSQYNDNAEGDSFGQIFADLLSGAASGSSSVLFDFVEFLEGNFGDYQKSNDPELDILLTTGTISQIQEEMDETELVQKQLSSKLETLQSQIYEALDDLGSYTRYMDKMKGQEKLDELQAQKDIVDNYLKKANQRLLKFQERYKQLIVNDSASRQTVWEDIKDYSTSGNPGSADRTSQKTRSSSRTEDDPATTARTSSSSKEESWKSEGFGSYGRRGSSRSRRQRGSSASSSSSKRQETKSSSSSTGRTQRPSPQPTSSSSPKIQQQSTSDYSYQPPHRRSRNTFAQQQENEKRLREIKVDEEFDKMKKELGL